VFGGGGNSRVPGFLINKKYTISARAPEPKFSSANNAGIGPSSNLPTRGQFNSKQERIEPEPEPSKIPIKNIKQEMFGDKQQQPKAQVQEQGDEDSYDDLTVQDLISLFQNFKELDKDSQEQLILYMKKLEATNPKKVALIKSSLQKM
jgi:hypothetical protein